MMAQFRKKPVVIEAFRFTGGGSLPGWFVAAAGEKLVINFGDHADIHTLEGVMKASDGDWIIRGVKNEIYPCKPDIFAAIYEAVS